MIRFFNQDGYKHYTFNRRDVSKYFPNPMKLALRNSVIKADHYILCPVYGNANRWTDFQIGVTGAPGVNEEHSQGIIRELKEELGIKLIHNNHLNNIVSMKGRKNWEVFTLDIKNTDNVARSLQINVNDSKDNKVGCVVYGDKFQTEMYMDSKIVLYKSADGIVGVVAIQAGILRKEFL